MSQRHPGEPELLAHLDAPDAAIAGHLDGCPACRRRLDGFARTLEAAAAAPAPAWSPLQAESVRLRTRRAVFAPRRRPAPTRWRAGLVGAALAGALGAWALTALVAPAPSTDGIDPEAVAVLGADDVAASAAQVDEEALIEQIDAYLMATATEGELLEALQDFSDDDLYALLDDSQDE